MRESLCAIVVNVLDCEIEESEFEIQSYYSVHFLDKCS